jgi:hypothetical protein
MQIVKLGLLIVFMAMVPGYQAAAEERVSPLLRSMLDGGTLPTEKVFFDIVNDNYISQLSADNINEFLPLARTLLQNSRPEARKYGLMCFNAITCHHIKPYC